MSDNKLATAAAFVGVMCFLFQTIPYIYKHTVPFFVLVLLVAVLKKQSVEFAESTKIGNVITSTALTLYHEPEIDHLIRLVQWQNNRYNACIQSGVRLAGLADNYRLQGRITSIVGGAELKQLRTHLEEIAEAEKTTANDLQTTIERQNQRIRRSTRRHTRFVAQSSNEKKVLIKENAGNEERVGQLQDELEGTKGQVTRLQQHIAELEARVHEQAENIEARDERILELEDELSGSRQQENSLLRQIGQLERRAQHHADELLAFENELHSVVNETREASQTIDDLEDENVELREGLLIALPRVGLTADLDPLEAARQLVEFGIPETPAESGDSSAETGKLGALQPLLEPEYGMRDDVVVDEHDIDNFINDGLTEDLLGEGTYGTVQRWENPGTDNGLSQVMAVKIMKLGGYEPEKSPSKNDSDIRNNLVQAGAVFRQEAELLCRLKHDNIVACRLWKICDNGVHMAALLDYKDGDLVKAIENGEYLSPHDGFNLIGDISSALMYLHSQGLVHLDIKPENICYQVGGTQDRASFCLLDFNLASEERDVTSSGEVGGTPMYMAPEFAYERESPRFSTKSDMYSFWVTLTDVCNFGGLGLHEQGLSKDSETHAYAVDMFSRNDDRAQDWADIGEWSPDLRPSAATVWNRWRMLSQLPREFHEIWPEDRPRRNRALARVFKNKPMDARKSFMKFHGVLYAQLEEYLYDGLRDSIMEPGL